MKRPLQVPSDLAEELDRLRQRVAELERDQAVRPGPRETAGPVPSSHYRLLYEDTPSMSFGLTPDGTVLSVNRFGAEQLGYVPDELIGRSVLTVFDPADHRTVQDQLTVCAQHPYKIFQWDLQKLHRSGRRLWVRETARAVRDESGALLVLVMCEDITKRKAAEEETRTLTDTLEALIRTSPLAIMALDNLGENVTLWNHAAESMFGWSEEEVLGRPAPFLTEDRREHSDRLWAELLERGKLQGAELRRIRRDGTPIDLSLWAMVLRDERGDIVGTFGLLADITERKQMEASLRLSEQAIRELYEITSGTTSTFGPTAFCSSACTAPGSTPGMMRQLIVALADWGKALSAWPALSIVATHRVRVRPTSSSLFSIKSAAAPSLGFASQRRMASPSGPFSVLARPVK